MARTQYSAQFKAKIVLEVLKGEKELGTIAYENNINPNMLRGWKREFLDHASEVFENPRKAEKPEEGNRPDAENHRTAFASADCPCPNLVQKNNPLSMRRQCELLGISRSTLYYKQKEPDAESVRRKEEILSRIDYWHTMMPYMGTRKLAAKLCTEGYAVGRKRIRTYMQEMGIHAVYPKPNLSKRNFKERIVPYLLRNKAVCFPNQVWSIDITYIKMQRGHMYLTAIIDWFSRKIMGWELSDTLETAQVLDAVQSAVECFGIPAILNSDQGSQFTSLEYKALLRSLNIRQSMDGRSRWADNIMIERWFRSLKTEMIYVNEFRSPKELRQAIRQYVCEYNTLRPHEALNYEIPEDIYRSCFASTAVGLDRTSMAC